MGNSSSADKLTDPETTALKHFNSKDFASLMKLLEQEPVDLFKIVSFNKDNPEDIKNGYDFIHTLLSVDHQSFGSSSSSSSAVSILKAFKQTIESNKKKNTTDKKLFRETPQFDKFPYSYLQFVIFNNPQDLDSFIFLLDNKETFPSPPPASQSLVHDLCSNPRAIELLRHLISSGEFPERFENTSSTNNLDEQMRGSANSVVIEQHRSYTPLQAACAAANKLAVQELCVAGLGGSNYGECAETLLTTAIAGEQDHNLGSIVLFKKENARALAKPQDAFVDDVADILLCLLAQPNAGSWIRKHRLRPSPIQSRKALEGVIAVCDAQFKFPPDEILNLMHLAFAFHDTLNKNTNNNSKSSITSADTFLKTVVDNKLAVCTPEELTLTSGILFNADTRKVGESEIESALKLIEKYRLREWLITSEQEVDLSSCGEAADDDTLRYVSTAVPSLQGLNLTMCGNITDTGLQHLSNVSSLQSLNLAFCKKITDSGLQYFTKLSSLRSLNLHDCDRITDSGLQHLAELSSLQSLDLWRCDKITDSGLKHLAKLSSLRTLNLQSCDKITDTGLQHLSQLSSLQSLNLRYCKWINDSGLQHLAKLPSLQSLNLWACKYITDTGLQHLAKLSSLRTLDLSVCAEITDSGLEHLTNVSSLQTLKLYNCYKIADSSLQHLAKLSCLQTLDLSWCYTITDNGLEHLSKLPSLHSLSLEDCNIITDSGLRHLTNLSSLQSLNLHECYKITDSGLQHLAKLSSLQTLNLYGCWQITDSGLQDIAKLSSLQSLNLEYCKQITDSGLQHLSNLSSLQSLNLSRCDKITDNGIQHLEKLSSLQSLDLTSCKKITDSGLQHLSQLSSLQSLNLQYCDKITDSGLQHLSNLSSLQSLNLGRCTLITDTGLDYLAHLSSLQALDLTLCRQVTHSGLDHFKTKSPSTRIKK